jgi:hypothetical protein
MVFSIAIGVALLGSLTEGGRSYRTQAQLPSSQVDHRAEWQEALRSVVRAEGVAMMFDVNLNNPPPRGYEKQMGTQGLDLLAALTHRKRVEREDVHIFVRNADPSQVPYRSHVNQIAAFLEALPLDLQARVVGDGLPISLIPDELRHHLANFLVGWNTAGPAAALAGWERTVIQVRPRLLFEYRDPSSGEEREGSVSDKNRTEPLLYEEAAKALRGARPLSSEGQRPKSRSGDFKFGEGKILTLRELKAEADKHFELNFLLDQRVWESIVFVAGSYDRAAFELAFAAVSEVKPASPRLPDTRDPIETFERLGRGVLNSLLSESASGQTDADITFRDAWNRLPMTFGELTKGSESTRTSYRRHGLPDDMPVRTNLGFSLSVKTLEAQVGVNGDRIARWSQGVPIGIRRR